MCYRWDIMVTFYNGFVHDILSQHENINYSSDLVVFMPNIKSFSLRPTAVSHTYFHCSARIQSYKATDMNLCRASIIITLHPICPADSMNASLTLMLIQARSLPTFHLPGPLLLQQDALLLFLFLLFHFFFFFFHDVVGATDLSLFGHHPNCQKPEHTVYVFHKFLMDRCHLLLEWVLKLEWTGVHSSYENHISRNVEIYLFKEQKNVHILFVADINTKRENSKLFAVKILQICLHVAASYWLVFLEVNWWFIYRANKQRKEGRFICSDWKEADKYQQQFHY